MLADASPQDATIRDMTSQLLNLMPTFPDVSRNLADALLEKRSADALATLWTLPSQGAQPPVILAAHLKYTIEVSTSLLRIDPSQTGCADASDPSFLSLMAD